SDHAPIALAARAWTAPQSAEDAPLPGERRRPTGHHGVVGRTQRQYRGTDALRRLKSARGTKILGVSNTKSASGNQISSGNERMQRLRWGNAFWVMTGPTLRLHAF